MQGNALVTTRLDAGVATVTLADPARRNVLSPEMVMGIVSAYDQAEADASVRCVILLGDGRAFSAGAELSVLEASAAGDFSGIEDVYRGFLRVVSSSLPTIAVVAGPAIGAGFNLALACDLRLATTEALFDTRFMALRLIPGGGHTWMLERAVGREVASAMVLFGERLQAVAALKAGLVYKVLPDVSTAITEAERLAQKLAELDRDFVTSLTGLARFAPTLKSHTDALELERFMQRWSMTRPPVLKGVQDLRASVERRGAPRRRDKANIDRSANTPSLNGDN
jgi:enoyl-CoA hydratase